jgi:hypothetical protein
MSTMLAVSVLLPISKVGVPARSSSVPSAASASSPIAAPSMRMQNQETAQVSSPKSPQNYFGEKSKS